MPIPGKDAKMDFWTCDYYIFVCYIFIFIFVYFTIRALRNCAYISIHSTRLSTRRINHIHTQHLFLVLRNGTDRAVRTYDQMILIGKTDATQHSGIGTFGTAVPNDVAVSCLKDLRPIDRIIRDVNGETFSVKASAYFSQIL